MWSYPSLYEIKEHITSGPHMFPGSMHTGEAITGSQLVQCILHLSPGANDSY